MTETKKCARCGAAFESSPWSASEACPDCTGTFDPPPPGDGGGDHGGDEDGPSQTAWSIRPPTDVRRSQTTRILNRSNVVAHKDSEVAEVSVVEEEVPLSRVDDILRLGESGRALPGSSSGARKRLGETGFWLVLAMGVMPLFLGGIANPLYRLTGMLFFFALLWGGVFHGVVVRSHVSLGLPLLAFFFTGVVGLFILYTAYSFLPDAYLHLALGGDPVGVLVGQVLQVGLCEEACKLLPAVLYLAVKRDKASPETAVLIGVFSGLGFAAFENIQYSQAMVMSTIREVYSAARNNGLRGVMEGAEAGAYQVMGAMLLRTFSLVFLHAVFSGISASLLVMGRAATRGRAGLCAAALLVPALLHGLYNWLGEVNTLPAGLIIAASFVFFYLNMDKVRAL